MARKLPLICILFLIVFSSCSERPDQHPNVVILFVDDLGWSELGCYGNGHYETPHIDALASTGILFTNAYASAPVCSPSRASMLTGKYPARVKITDWIPGHQAMRGPRPSERFLVSDFRNELPAEEVTLAEVLGEIGYKTASIGKWHLGGEGYLPTDQGFDMNIAGTEKGQPPSYYHPYRRKAGKETWTLPGLDTILAEPYLTDRLTSEAMEFIRSSAGTPFFLYLPFFTVHTPIQGREDLVDYYSQKFAEKDDSLHFNPSYAAMVHCLDENIGRVMHLLDSLAIRENTLIIFASDNGGLYIRNEDRILAAWNHPLRAGKGYVYEGGIRVPTIITGPWVERLPGRSDQAIATIDFMPTILEYLGADSPPGMDGVSLLRLLSSDSVSIERQNLYWHYPHYHKGMPASVIRSGNYKLIEFLQDGSLELYDLGNDLSEQYNLADEIPVLRDSLFRELQDWKKSIDAYFPGENPEWNGH